MGPYLKPSVAYREGEADRPIRSSALLRRSGSTMKRFFAIYSVSAMPRIARLRDDCFIGNVATPKKNKSRLAE
jgi:hypothetical protein